MLPDYGDQWLPDGTIQGVVIKHPRLTKMITDALDEAKNDKADDPNRLNYTINAVEAIVENRSQRTEQNLREAMETRVTALETKIDTLTKMLQTLIDKQP
jgi:predicted ArsR family transcriptional regulator